MNTRPTFTFPGLWPYIERAAEGLDLAHLGRGRGLWHYKQVQDALGQYPTLDAEARRGVMENVAAIRDALAAALAGIDLAVRESVARVEGEPAVPPADHEDSPQTPAPAAPLARRKRP